MLDKLQSRPKLVSYVNEFEHRLKGNIEQYKATVQLKDGSLLHINEVWLAGVLHKYAYYWLTPAGTVLQGWDNAPHHKHIATYPHHVHQDDQVFPSHVRSLANVLDLLEERLLPL